MSLIILSILDQNNYENQLVNIFNGIVLPNEIADQLPKAKENGWTEVVKFVNERFQSVDKTKFWDKIK